MTESEIMAQLEKKSYLGDGLYAGVRDDDTIILWAPREDGVVHWVGLAPETLAAFQYWLKQLYP